MRLLSVLPPHTYTHNSLANVPCRHHLLALAVPGTGRNVLKVALLESTAGSMEPRNSVSLAASGVSLAEWMQPSPISG